MPLPGIHFSYSTGTELRKYATQINKKVSMFIEVTLMAVGFTFIQNTYLSMVILFSSSEELNTNYLK